MVKSLLVSQNRWAQMWRFWRLILSFEDPRRPGIKGSLGTNSRSASAAMSLVDKPANHDTEWHGTRCWANVKLLLEACLHQTPFRKVPFLVPCLSVCGISLISWIKKKTSSVQEDVFKLSVPGGQGFWIDCRKTNEHLIYSFTSNLSHLQCLIKSKCCCKITWRWWETSPWGPVNLDRLFWDCERFCRFPAGWNPDVSV